MSGYDGFAPIYDAWSEDMTEDVDYYIELAAAADGPVVELAMLAVARERAAAAGVDLELREGDMRDFSLEEPAALVICPFRSLLHLPTWRDRRRVFERVAASLRPGGRFAWNAFVFDFSIAAGMHDRWQDEPVRHWIVQVPADNRIDIFVEGGPSISLWWVSRGEWEALLDVAGLETEELFGWFDRRPFDESSRELVWVARKPAT